MGRPAPRFQPLNRYKRMTLIIVITLCCFIVKRDTAGTGLQTA